MDKFIKTFDYETMKELKNQGFTIISPENSDSWIFLIDKPMNFSDEIKKKVVLTNVITI